MEWQIIDAFFEDTPYPITKHHLRSYDHFVSNSLLQIIKALNPFVVRREKLNASVYVGGKSGAEVFVSRPTDLPSKCRLNNLTYQSVVTCNIDIEFLHEDKVVSQRFTDVKLCTLPVMLHSRLCFLHGQPPDVLRSMGECPIDQGGYFVVGGLEKVIIAQERNAYNRLYVREGREEDGHAFKARIQSLPEDEVGAALFPKALDFVVYSGSHRGGIRRNAITVKVPSISSEVPLCVLFRALGIESDYDILQYIVHDMEAFQNAKLLEFLSASITDGNFIKSQRQAWEYLRPLSRNSEFLTDEEHRFDIVKFILAEDVFPTAGTDFRTKAHFLGDAALRLVKTAVGAVPVADRDNMRHKRVDVSGMLMSNLFRDLYSMYRNECRKLIEKTYMYGPVKNSGDMTKLINGTNMNKIFNHALISSNIMRSFKGNWLVAKDAVTLQTVPGIVQDLSRLTYLNTISNLRRVNQPISDTAANMVQPHMLNTSQFGMMCPVESPDGKNIGLLKHFATTCQVTFDSDVSGVISMLGDRVHRLSEITPLQAIGKTKVLINNVWFGTCDEPEKLLEWARLHRRNALVSPFLSLSWDVFAREIRINTDVGRCCRPLLIVDEGNQLRIGKDSDSGPWKWADMIRGQLCPPDAFDEGAQKYVPATKYLPAAKDDEAIRRSLQDSACIIEFLDVEESESCLIAMDQESLRLADPGLARYSHCELHPSMMLGMMAANLPLVDHTGAARNILSSAQTKQGIGLYATNFVSRMDQTSYVLHYPQRPLVHTRVAGYLNNNVLNHGENVIVAICSYTGYNQEDGIIINKSSVERGLLNISAFKVVQTMEEDDMSGRLKLRFGNSEELERKGVELPKRRGGMGIIGKDGLPIPGKAVHEGDVVVGQYMTSIEETKDDNWNRVIRTTTHADKSIVADRVIHGVVDRVHCFEHDHVAKLRTCKVRLREMRPPAVGDKVASRHSQKGCIGYLMPAEDMPFVGTTGLVPDIMINPHGFPKRMTVSHILEMLIGKACCMAGMTADSTAFNGTDVLAYGDMLEKQFNMNRHGSEILYAGLTGRMMQCEVYTCPMYYMRLKHMVADKVNYRHSGGRVALTRQPVKGRSVGGGLRIGEMEAWGCWGHGIMGFLKESFSTRSDGGSFTLDAEGEYAGGSMGVCEVEQPYAFKLMCQELEAAGIRAHQIVDEDGDDSSSVGSWESDLEEEYERGEDDIETLNQNAGD
jgi:DNA-directed RNA polymerase II subunit RPB2